MVDTFNFITPFKKMKQCINSTFLSEKEISSGLKVNHTVHLIINSLQSKSRLAVGLERSHC